MADKNIAKKEKAIEIMKKMDIYKPYILVQYLKPVYDLRLQVFLLQSL